MKNIILVFIIVSSFLFSNCTSSEDKILPLRKDVTESVYSSVIIQPDSVYQVYASVTGILDENLVDEGELVSKDDALIQIINSTPKLNTENTRLSLVLARENYNGSAAILDGIKEEITAASLKYQNDSINFFRQKKLWDQNIGSKMEFDSKKLNYELSLNTLKLLESRYNRTKNDLLTAVKQAENNYNSSLINTKDFTVKSKINGKIYALYKNPGELVTTLEPLASVGSRNNFVIEMLVDEVDIVKIIKNQKVLVSLDAYNDQIFDGIVSKILPKKDERNQTFTVEALFNQQPKVLYPGLSGEANIIIDKRENVLTIPKEYLIDGSKVKTENGIIEVEIGLQNLDIVEIVSGIDENTYIYKPDQ